MLLGRPWITNQLPPLHANGRWRRAAAAPPWPPGACPALLGLSAHCPDRCLASPGLPALAGCQTPAPSKAAAPASQSNMASMCSVQLGAPSFAQGQRLRAAARPAQARCQARPAVRCQAGATAAAPAGEPGGWLGGGRSCRCAHAWSPPRRRPPTGPRPLRPAAAPKMFQHDGTLDEVDPEMAQIIRSEKQRQVRRCAGGRREVPGARRWPSCSSRWPSCSSAFLS